MKGQAETTEILSMIGLIVVLVAIIPIILPTIQKAIESFTMDSSEIISKDLASLISTAVAATNNIKIEYLTPSRSLYDVDIKDRMITVSRELREGEEKSSDPILIDAKGHFSNTNYFTIEKKIEDDLVNYYINDELIFSYEYEEVVPPGSSFPPGPPAIIIPGENKFGLNLAAKHDQVDRGVIEYVNEGGWVVMMPTANNYNSETANQVYDEIVNNYFKKLGGQVNYVLRAHYPHASNPEFNDNPTFPDKNDPKWAEKWSDFWSSIINRLPIPEDSNFYIVPWNEPNFQRECSGIGDVSNANDCDCAPYVLEYIDQLERKLNNKVILLTPMFGISAPNFYKFAECLGGKSFFDRFDGISLAYYDFETGCNEPFCNPNPRFNPDKYNELLNNIGASGKKLFIIEIGLVSPGQCGPGVPDCPNFDQPDITNMLCQLYENHKGDPNFVMFSPLTYDPEKGSGNWFWDTSQTRSFYLQREGYC